MKTPDLARRLGRKKAGVFNKAFALGLRHGFMRAFTDDEKRAIYLAYERGVSITDLSHALCRDPAVNSKHAIGMGIPFSARMKQAPRRPRANRQALTLRDLDAMHRAGLLDAVAEAPGLLLLTRFDAAAGRLLSSRTGAASGRD